MRRRLAIKLGVFLTLFLLLAKPVLAEPEPPPRVTANSAILVEWKTGTVLFEKNARQKRSPASLTKMMTALLALEKGQLDDIITVSPEATRVSGSRIYLKPGQKFTLGDLLQGLLLKSANDAALAIAEHIGGSVDGFVQMMNERARELGALDTQFKNPHGLTAPGHYSTAYDLALIARYALRNPVFAHLVSLREAEISELTKAREISLRNTNRLLWGFAGADGVKTGTTSLAGNCLVASATRGSSRYIAVVLHSDNRWRDAATLLDYAFANYKVVEVVQAGDVLTYLTIAGGRKGEVPLAAAKDLVAVIPVGREGDLLVEIDKTETVKAPVQKGEGLGAVTLWLGGAVLGQTPLVAVQDVAAKGWQDYFVDIWRQFLLRVGDLENWREGLGQWPFL